MPTLEELMLLSSIFLIISVLVSNIAERAGIPLLLLFIAIGMLAGSDGLGKIYFDNVQLAQSVGIVALVLILYSGGLNTQWEKVRPVFIQSMLLATVGVFISTLLAAVFMVCVFRFTLLEGLLFGAIIAPTDAAAVFAVLRSIKIPLAGQMVPLVELESGLNDPMSVFLTQEFTQLLVNPKANWWDLVPLFFMQMFIGAISGLLLGYIAIQFIRHLKLGYEGLYPIFTLALALFTYSLTSLLHGSGFLAVFLAGIYIGNNLPEVRGGVVRFHDSIAWLMQISMFVTLGLLAFPSRILPILGVGVLCALFLALIARPLSVLFTLILSSIPKRQQLFIAWMGFRGAVPIILATFPLLAGVPKARLMFDLVFFIVIASVLIQGITFPWIAKWLGVIENGENTGE